MYSVPPAHVTALMFQDLYCFPLTVLFMSQEALVLVLPLSVFHFTMVCVSCYHGLYIMLPGERIITGPLVSDVLTEELPRFTHSLHSWMGGHKFM